MSYRITWKERDNQRGLDRRIAVLEDGRGGCVEIWPALGFNAYRWAVQVEGTTHELLHADPKLFEDGRPTRSGIPILFPFPNRIRDGKYTWNGKTYQLPLTGDGGKTAIHGFACRVPWRVIDEGADKDSAWITGEFQISKDDPASLAVWPADGRLRVTYRLMENRLRVEAAVDNPGAEPLPFGLGYHPYFALAPFGDEDAEIDVPCTEIWQLLDGLPTGAKQHRLQRIDPDAPKLEHQVFDDLLTGISRGSASPDSPYVGICGMIRKSFKPRLFVYASQDFGAVVLFTPPHRQAICIEPYTCLTDAINLQTSGVDTGWKALNPGQSWRGPVEFLFDPYGPADE